MSYLKTVITSTLLALSFGYSNLEAKAEDKAETIPGYMTSKTQLSESRRMLNEPKLLKILGLTERIPIFPKKIEYRTYVSESNTWVHTSYSNNGEVSVVKGLKAKFEVPHEDGKKHEAYTFWLAPKTNNILAVTIGDCTLKKIVEPGKSYIFGNPKSGLDIKVQRVDSIGIQFSARAIKDSI